MPKMRCELRDHEADHLAVLPIPQSDGSFDTMACLDHARETEFFCRRHDHPHIGLGNGTHACLSCIEEQVAELAPQAPEISKKLSQGLPQAEFDRFLEYSLGISVITYEGDLYIPILRAVITSAERLGKPWELVVEEALSRRSAENVVPSYNSDRLRKQLGN